MVTRGDLHEMVDGLTEEEIDRAARLLETLREPALSRLDDAPLEDEEITLEEESLVQEGRDAVARGEVVTTAELRRELGL